jgi:preprotein translocase subunit SecY/protein transport protein SEC61 subunit alpha
VASLREFVQTAATVLPEVPKPQRKPSLNEKFVWTGLALVAYLIMAITPLYKFTGQSDPFASLRIIFASTQGSLMELGIGPIVTAGLILQLLKGSDIIKLNFSNPDDRALFSSATKLLTFIVIAIEAGAYILGGALGTLSSVQSVVIFLQLFVASVIVLLLDEMIQKGWGIGSGISLFILGGVAQTVFWFTFSPFPVPTSNRPGSPTEIFGFVPALLSAIFSGNFGSIVLRSYRFPSLFTFILTVAVILVIVYIEGIRVEVPITSIKYRGFQGVYPIKLLYVSNIPVILVSALGANVTFFARLIYSNFNWITTNPYLNWIATYDPTSKQAIGGLVYYVQPPQGLSQTLGAPLHSLVYVAWLVTGAVIFAKIWVDIGGLSARAAAQNLIDADVQVPGFRRASLSIEQVLNRYIPPITIIGGILIGLIAAVSDLFGVFGTGIGILLMVDIVLQYYQLLVKEQIEEFSPRLAGMLGQS